MISVERLGVAGGDSLRDWDDSADCAEAGMHVSRAMAVPTREGSDLRLILLRTFQVAMKPPGLVSCFTFLWNCALRVGKGD